MTEFILGGGKGTIVTDPQGILRLTWTPGSIVEADGATEAVLAVQRLSGKEMRPLLVALTDVHLAAGARRIFLETRFVAAVALVGATVVDRVVAAALQRKRKCPQAFFTSTVVAVEWLEGLPAPEGAEGIPA
ncbi:STAS/SEC14 domain-containing protein [Pseudarthrobacter sp. S9]|uniref:DUF7793 family protein n=1 Tax=Pseudarthrobacter sp. S9 TaxID=3418421 RepID=UPI003CFD24AF